MTITCKWKLSKKSDLKSSKRKDWSILIKDPDFAEDISKNIISYITYNTVDIQIDPNDFESIITLQGKIDVGIHPYYDNQLL